jgi:hypothetical protein
MSDVSTPTVPPEVLKTFSDAVAQSIAAQQSGAGQAPAAAGGPVVTLGEGATTITGGFSLKITYDSTTYALVVAVPTKAGDPYVFSATMTPDQKPTVTLASLKFVDASNWSVVITLPSITIGTVTINELSLNLSDGTVPATS